MQLFINIFILSLMTTTILAQANYDESKVPKYTPIDPLQTNNGRSITTTEAWEQRRRPQLLELFAKEVYGKVPGEVDEVSFEVTKDMDFRNGTATLQEITCTLTHNDDQAQFTMLLLLPKSEQPVPVFLGLNFYGNHTIHPNENITLHQAWVRNNEDFYITDNQATEASRGVRSYRWPMERMLDRGYGLATIYYGELVPDENDGLPKGITRFFMKKNQTEPKADEWGAIAAWAWGLSRGMDYLEQNEAVDSERVIVIGHSRLGKASLWAGATDERFAMVVSNESGCGGAALSKRKYGETVKVINERFPHWFCDNFNAYNDQEEKLPLDQHLLLALMAPRPLYVGSAWGDQWADPKGEFLATKYASPVYALYGKKGVEADGFPPINYPLQKGSIGYHVRWGGHDLTAYDWEMYMNFADKHLSK